MRAAQPASRGAECRSTARGRDATIAAMAKDPIKNLKPLSPARLEEREWMRRAEEAKKTRKAKVKSKRTDTKLKA
ncbi:MAG: hypothetical protein ACJ71Q_21295 [Terriglobales bacterium]|jgi:hypothetical protein